MSNPQWPSFGEVWQLDFNPTQGHEQAGIRPALVVSNDIFNHGPAGMVVVLPVTTRFRMIPLRVAIDPPEGGIGERSYIKCEDIRAVSVQRLRRRYGTVSGGTMDEVADRLRILLNL
jgi:mRNA interferase MazF